MKKLLITLTMVSFFGAMIFTFTSCKQGWSASDRSTFINNCSQSAAGNMGADKAKSYCTCMEQKLEVKFPNPKDAAKLTTESMQTPEMQALINGCLNVGGNNNNGGNGGNPNNGGNGGLGNILGNGGNNNGGNGGGGNTGGGWSAADEQSFLNSCTKNATNAGADQQTSTTHCNCVLKKIEAKYNSLSDANRLASKQEVDAMEQECLQERMQNNQ